MSCPIYLIAFKQDCVTKKGDKGYHNTIIYDNQIHLILNTSGLN